MAALAAKNFVSNLSYPLKPYRACRWWNMFPARLVRNGLLGMGWVVRLGQDLFLGWGIRLPILASELHFLFSTATLMLYMDGRYRNQPLLNLTFIPVPEGNRFLETKARTVFI